MKKYKSNYIFVDKQKNIVEEKTFKSVAPVFLARGYAEALADKLKTKVTAYLKV